MEIDFRKIRKIYFVGIKGSGMVALVELFYKLGIETVGSDVKETFFTDQILKDLGIYFYEGFDKENIKKERDCDLLIYSTSYNKDNNEEILWAEKNGIKRISYPEAIGQYMKNKFSIAVCGTHGKTTTTAMLSLAMKDSNADPTAIVGSKIKQIGSNLIFGHSKYFVLEADEYQNKLKHYNPTVVILTSVDYDHPDFFHSFDEYKKVFKDFANKIPSEGFLLAWGEDDDVVEVAYEAKCNIVFYGEFLQTRRVDFLKKKFKNKRVDFVITPSDLKLKIPGKHNILNATAAFAVCEKLCLERLLVMDSLRSFEGTTRRFEYIGELNGAIIIDDYAHHPREVEVTLEALKDKYPQKNIVCVFHPHTFTRTQVLLDEFSKSFKLADEFIALDVYGSAREKQGGVTSSDLIEKVSLYNKNVKYIPGLDEAFNYLKDYLGKNDVLITMGAGNVCDLAKKLVQKK